MNDPALRLFGVIHLDRPGKVERELADVAEGSDALFIEQPRSEITLRTVALALAKAPLATAGMLFLLIAYAPLQVLLVRDVRTAEQVAAARVSERLDVAVHAVDDHPVTTLAGSGLAWPVVNYLVLAPLVWYAPVGTAATLALVVASWLVASLIYRLDHRVWLFAHVPLTWGAFLAALALPAVPVSLLPLAVAVLLMSVLVAVTFRHRNEYMIDAIAEISDAEGYDAGVLLTGKAHLGGLRNEAEERGLTVPLVHVSKFCRSSSDTYDPREERGRTPATVPGSERETFLERAAAAAIDVVVSGLLGVLAGIVAGALTTGLVGDPWLGVILGLFLAPFVYFVEAEARYGRTLGKRLLGLAVTTTDGDPPSRHAVVVRNLLRPIDVLGFYLVGFVVAFLTQHRQRLGDLAAGTVVRTVTTVDASESAASDDATPTDASTAASDDATATTAADQSSSSAASR